MCVCVSVVVWVVQRNSHVTSVGHAMKYCIEVKKCKLKICLDFEPCVNFISPIQCSSVINHVHFI